MRVPELDIPVSWLARCPGVRGVIVEPYGVTTREGRYIGSSWGVLAALSGEADGSHLRDTHAYGRLRPPRRALVGQLVSDYTDAASRSARSARDAATQWSGRVAYTDPTAYASHPRGT